MFASVIMYFVHSTYCKEFDVLACDEHGAKKHFWVPNKNQIQGSKLKNSLGRLLATNWRKMQISSRQSV